MLQSLRLSAVTFVLLSIASASEAVSTALLPFHTTLDISSSDCVLLSLSATSCRVLRRMVSFAYCKDAILALDDGRTQDAAASPAKE